MKPLLALLTGALLTLCFSSCSPLPPLPNDAEVVPLELHPLYPLEVGRFWVYRTYKYNFETPYGPGGPTYSWVDSSDFSEIIRRDTVVKYKDKFYRAVLFLDKDAPPYWSNSNELAYFTTLSITPSTNYFRKLLQYPIQKGDTFMIERTFAPFESVQTRRQPIICVGTNEDIRVPAGNFKCYGFEFEPQTVDGHALYFNTGYTYYAPGIGPVCYITTIGKLDKGGQILYKTVLLQYGTFRSASPPQNGGG